MLAKFRNWNFPMLQNQFYIKRHRFLPFEHMYVIKYKNRWFCGKIHVCSSEHPWTMLATPLGSWCDDSQVSLNASKCSIDNNEADFLVQITATVWVLELNGVTVHLFFMTVVSTIGLGYIDHPFFLVTCCEVYINNYLSTCYVCSVTHCSVPKHHYGSLMLTWWSVWVPG
jgi:hypothetical protein